MTNLTTQYLGLTLKSPLIASAGPDNANLGHLKRLEDAGAAAVVLPSLFEDQIVAAQDRYDRVLAAGAGNNPEAHDHYFPDGRIAQSPFEQIPERYLEHVRRARESLSIPVIASLNGAAPKGWADYGARLQQAGAHAVELNLHSAAALDFSESADQIEARYLAVVRELRGQISIPLSVKIPPYFTSVGHMAQRIVEAGANGLVLFNRTPQTDIHLNRLTLSNEVIPSQAGDMHLSLQWIRLLAGRVKASLGASAGVETAEHVIKYLYAGADAVMATSAVLRHGAGHFTALRDGLDGWLDARRVKTLDAIRGTMSALRFKSSDDHASRRDLALLQAWHTQPFVSR